MCVHVLLTVRQQSADQHFQQTILTGSQLEEQTEEALFRKGEFLQWNDDLPRENEVLEQYNRLSYNPDDVAMFRAQDYDEPAEWAAVDAEDVRCMRAGARPRVLVLG